MYTIVHICACAHKQTFWENLKEMKNTMQYMKHIQCIMLLINIYREIYTHLQNTLRKHLKVIEIQVNQETGIEA